MKAIVCEMCGSQNLVKQDGMYVCQSCGTNYTPDDAKKLMVEVDHSEKLDSLYNLARQAKAEDNSEAGAKYYGEILVLAPDDWEAQFYNAYFDAMNHKVAEINIAISNLRQRCKTVLSTVAKMDISDSEKKKIYTEIADKMKSAAIAFHKSAYNTYLHTDATTSLHSDSATKMVSSVEMLRSTAEYIDEYFSDKETVLSVYKAAFNLACKCKFFSMNLTRSTISDRIKAIDPSFDAAEAKKQASGCYVATAVYGSYDCPQVWTLRRYRDDTLAKTWYGRLFIHTYYAISPTLVKWFGNTDWFRNMWKPKLDRMVSNLNSEGVDNTPYEDKNW